MITSPARAAILAAALAAVLLACASDARACDHCLWGTLHPTDGPGFQQRVEHFNATLAPGVVPITDGRGQGAGARQLAVTQQVWVDFSAQSGAYDAGEIASVLAGIQSIYGAWDLTFSLTQPTGSHTRLIFDNGGFGGVADEIDFRNLNLSNNAFIGTGSGIPTDSTQQVNYAVNVGSHELGHTLGLRHQDGYGPIGFGTPNEDARTAFFPDFPGSNGATEFSGNVMSTPAWGSDVNVFLNSRASHSERELIKLAYNEQGTAVAEAPGAKDTIGTAQPLTMQTLAVPNTRPPGTQFHGETFDVTAAVVTGRLSTTTEDDFYSFSADAGDLLIVEIISLVLDRMTDQIDGLVTVRNGAGTILPYFSSTASNDDEPETFDSLIMDLTIPADGTYFVSVDRSTLASTADQSGDYELYIATFNLAVPEPATLGMLGLSALLLLRRRRS